jgi:hypothetical protein
MERRPELIATASARLIFADGRLSAAQKPAAPHRISEDAYRPQHAGPLAMDQAIDTTRHSDCQTGGGGQASRGDRWFVGAHTTDNDAAAFSLDAACRRRPGYA